MRNRLIDAVMQEWGLSFPEAKLNAVKELNRLKRFATVEVSDYETWELEVLTKR